MKTPTPYVAPIENDPPNGVSVEDTSVRDIPVPTVGRIVHFYTRNPSMQYHGHNGPYAAIVSSVGFDGEIGLTVFPVAVGTRPYPALNVPGATADSEHGYPEWWQWPEGV